MLDEDAEVLEATYAAWLIKQFEFEYCNECGGDTIDHVAGPDPLGNLHAYCKPIGVGERVEFVTGRNAKLTGTVIEVDRDRLRIVAEGDSYTSHWTLADVTQRSQPA